MEDLAYIIYSIALRTLSLWVGGTSAQLTIQERAIPFDPIPEPSLLYLFKTSNRYEILGMGVLA